jgi:hypothetical protein
MMKVFPKSVTVSYVPRILSVNAESIFMIVLCSSIGPRRLMHNRLKRSIKYTHHLL